MVKKGYEVTSLFSENNNISIKKFTDPNYRKIPVKCLIHSHRDLILPFRKLEFNLRVLFEVRKIVSNDTIIHINGDNGGFATFLRKGIKIYNAYGASSLVKFKTTNKNKNFLKQLYQFFHSAPSIFLEHLGYKYSNSIIADNEPLFNLIKRFKGKKNSLDLIYDSINLSEFKPPNSQVDKSLKRTELGLSSDKIYAIWVSTSKEKGQQEAIDSLEDTHNTILLLVGASSKKDNKCVKNLGYVDKQRLVSLFQASDYFILPTKKRAIDLSTIEALASGLPVLLYKQAYSFLLDENNAFLVDSYTQLKRTVEEIDKNPEILRSKKYPVDIIKMFSPQNSVEKYLEVFERRQ